MYGRISPLGLVPFLALALKTGQKAGQARPRRRLQLGCRRLRPIVLVQKRVGESTRPFWTSLAALQMTERSTVDDDHHEHLARQSKFARGG
jgi:hypothetical protein